ncbi:MAG: patatin-like phospholipase family protein [candidate division Zixibacteria bacterium]|nr:patatin-like phospholipase family protein [candidate division Zixibacteria bacterium]
MSRKIALVLSGGNAWGSFQFGAIKYIEEEIRKKFLDFDYSIIAGVSVGALNGVMLAMEKYDKLKEIWNNISNDQVYKGKISWTAIVKILLGAKSVLSNKPLKGKLDQHVFLKDVKSDKYDLRIGVVLLVSGEYKAFKPSDFDKDEDFRKAVLASTAIPLIWEPVKEINLKNNLHLENLVDGGVRNVSPLGDILDDDPSEVIIINCQLSKLEPDTKASKNFLMIAKRSLTEITINEIFNSDIQEYLTINYLVEQAKEKGFTLKKKNSEDVYKAYKTILIQPDKDLGDPLDFSQKTIQWRIEEGYQSAVKAFQGYVLE